MEYLQYIVGDLCSNLYNFSFKPYYKWNTFNTCNEYNFHKMKMKVLNLIINGIPSIQQILILKEEERWRFKPYYKWNTFNTTTSTRCGSFLRISF